MAYNVKIDVFEGPFDLLLHLVRVNEMDIYDISISNITNQYLSYIKEMQKLDLEVAGEFLVMAATLIHLKARTLMPPLSPDQEDPEEEEVDEEYQNIRSAQDLMRQLIEYRQFKELASRLSQREEDQLRIFYRNALLPNLGTSERGEQQEMNEDISLLFSAFARVLKYTEGRPTHHVVEEEYSVEEKIEIIKKSLLLDKHVNVSQLFKRCINKSEIITMFLAMLEVCRLKLSRVIQKGSFEEIYLCVPEEFKDDDE